MTFTCVAVFALLSPGEVSPSEGEPPRPENLHLEFFERKIRPLLANNCYNCHSANTNAQGGLRVDDRNGLIQGGGRGPAIVPGYPEKSLLLQAVRRTHPKLKMPPKKELPAGEIADLVKWIKDGAIWPAPQVPSSVLKPSAKYDKLRKEHWAWQPLHAVAPPDVKDDSWPHNAVDRFLLGKLKATGLRPVTDADRQVLIRRLTFDLTGLPPTPEETRLFVADNADDAYEKLVDRLLSSPAFGERWGRHWLDIARYGESTGSARNLPYPHAWRYRDYVIDAFNADKPYDQFIREQIAGDLLPAVTPAQRDEQLIATGFLALGVRDVNQRFKVRFIMDNVDEQIDTVGRALLALSLGCARCHNHKFDPIPTSEYYALAGIFRSTELCAGLRNKMGGGGLDYYDTALLLRLGNRPTKPDPNLPEKIAVTKKALAKARAAFKGIAGKPAGKVKGPDGKPKQMVARLEVNRLEKELLALSDPAMQGPVALGVRDSKHVADTEIRIRGEAEQLGPVVARGFLSIPAVPNAPKIDPQHSGRLELAQWLTCADNPLTSRVIVNRLWHHLFGRGLVASVDNFGVTGEKPSHPELLDFLALHFVRDGWSIKKLVRLLVLSHAYQLGSDVPAKNLAVDPGNRLLWRHSPRRLEAEEIRDAMLAAAGTLERARLKGSPAQELKVTELVDTSALAKQLRDEADRSRHRSIYLPLVRRLPPRALEVFDFADQGLVTGSRDATTVAPQALYLLNDPFVRKQSQALAQRAMRVSADENPVHLTYRLALGRSPTAEEIDRAQRYILDYAGAPGESVKDAQHAWGSFCHAVLASAEFRYLR